MRSILFLLGLASLLASCKQENSELTGHWVSTDYFEGKDFWTIDFEKENHQNAYSDNDTVIYIININKNSLASNGGYRMSLWNSEDKGVYEFCTVHDCDIVKIIFRKDTLFVKGDDYHAFDGSFVRIETNKVIYDELFNHTSLIGRLPNRKQGDIEQDFRKTLIIDLNIGKGKYDPAGFDSTRINVYDVFITFKDIPQYISRSRDGLPETDRNNAIICLNADSTVQNEFLNKVITEVSKVDSTLKIYQSTFDHQANKVYFRRIE